MSRIQLACTCLLASAFVLAGLLVLNPPSGFESEAEASLVITKDNFTLLTAKTRRDEESLFVLDNATGRLLIYRATLSPKEVSLAGAFDLRELFIRTGGGGGRGRRNR